MLMICAGSVKLSECLLSRDTSKPNLQEKLGMGSKAATKKKKKIPQSRLDFYIEEFVKN